MLYQALDFLAALMMFRAADASVVGLAALLLVDAA
jgi:hypothetical protein